MVADKVVICNTNCTENLFIIFEYGGSPNNENCKPIYGLVCDISQYICPNYIVTFSY